MIRALFYLQWHSLKNHWIARVKRLRRPKYLFGALVGGLYFYFYFFRFMFARRGHHAGPGLFGTPEGHLVLESIGALALLVIMLLAWIFPSDRAALAFTEAEVAFLFPAPITRRGLIQYRILRSQLAVLFSGLMMAVISRRAGGNVLTHALGWWLILSTLGLHFTASSFARTMLLDRGFSNRSRRIVTLCLVAGLGAFVWRWVHTSLPPLPAAGGDNDSDADAGFGGTSDWFLYSTQVFSADPVRYILSPFRWVVRPFFAPDLAAFAAALPAALLIYLVHYVWVVRADVAFEEASVTASQRLAARLAAMRAGNRRGMITAKKAGREWFRLTPLGPAPVAFLWKNLLAARGVLTTRLLISLSIIVVVFVFIVINGNHRQEISMAAVMIVGVILGYSVLLGPQILRLDFRSDLALADVLKTYPLPGWQIALGQILAPVAVLAALQWLILFVGMTFAVLAPMKPLTLYLPIALGLAVALPALDSLLLIIPNLSAVMFPAWFQAGKDGGRGMEVMGQRIIMGLAQMLVLLVALIPAALAFMVVFLVLKFAVSSSAAIPPAAVVATMVVLAETGLGVMLLGRSFDRFDVADDPAA